MSITGEDLRAAFELGITEGSMRDAVDVDAVDELAEMVAVERSERIIVIRTLALTRLTVALYASLIAWLVDAPLAATIMFGIVAAASLVLAGCSFYTVRTLRRE